jgi:hypothetical protein
MSGPAAGIGCGAELASSGVVAVPAAVVPSLPGACVIFGPVVEVPADAPLIDRMLRTSGRDPGWTTDR